MKKPEPEKVKKYLDEIWGHIQSENIPYIEKTLLLAEWGFEQRVAVSYAIGDMYKSVEDALRACLTKLEMLEIKSGANWHKELIELAASKGLLTSELKSELDNMRRFRHFFVHAYAHNISEKELRELYSPARDAFEEAVRQISGYYGWVNAK